jgi:hypothetical protein
VQRDARQLQLLACVRAHVGFVTSPNYPLLGAPSSAFPQGPTHPLALKRTFGSSEPIRVKLYRDHAAWCPYCQKVGRAMIAGWVLLCVLCAVRPLSWSWYISAAGAAGSCVSACWLRGAEVWVAGAVSTWDLVCITAITRARPPAASNLPGQVWLQLEEKRIPYGAADGGPRR